MNREQFQEQLRVQYSLPKLEEIDLTNKEQISKLEKDLLMLIEDITKNWRAQKEDEEKLLVKELTDKLASVEGVEVQVVDEYKGVYERLNKWERRANNYHRNTHLFVEYIDSDAITKEVEKILDEYRGQKNETRSHSLVEKLFGKKADAPKKEDLVAKLNAIPGVKAEERTGTNSNSKLSLEKHVSDLLLPDGKALLITCHSDDALNKLIVIKDKYHTQRLDLETSLTERMVEGDILLNKYVSKLYEGVTVEPLKQVTLDPIAHIYFFKGDQVFEAHYNMLSNQVTPILKVEGMNPSQFFDVIMKNLNDIKGNIYIVDTKHFTIANQNRLIEKGIEYAVSMYGICNVLNRSKPIERIKQAYEALRGGN